MKIKAKLQINLYHKENIQNITGGPIILILLIALTMWLATYTLKKKH